jgi:glyoxylase-like metal-dependent hydrolase (beta-lactamase superfamily II)
MTITRLAGLLAALLACRSTPPVTAQTSRVTRPTPPTWRLTGLLLIDRPPSAAAFWLQGREEGTTRPAFQVGVGNWDPRSRVTQHASFPVARAGWRFSTGLHEWLLPKEELEHWRHHVLIVDRPAFHQPQGKERERVLHIALATDEVTTGTPLKVRWRWRGVRGLDPLKNPRLVAFVQQAPAPADDTAGWTPLRLESAKAGEALVRLPASLKPGLLWLRIGLSEARAPGPSERLLAELPLAVAGDRETAGPPPRRPALRQVQIAPPCKQSHVPGLLRQGVFLHPQAVSAVDVSPAGDRIGVTTLAFRHDRNFWLLSDRGEVLGSRYVQPWAPFQTAVLPGGKAFGVGLAYSRFTDPSPTVALFAGEEATETALVDGFWDLGWLRYGHGDWRTGWLASLVGDLLVGSGGSIFTVTSHDGAWRLKGDGRRERYPLPYQRPFRLAASGDGHLLAFGYLVPDVSRLHEKTRRRLRQPPALLTARNALTGAVVWTAAPLPDTEPVAKPPEPADEFPAMAEDFNMKPLALVPFRAALSVAASGDGSTVALAEYGGWLRIKRERGIGHWNPDHPVPFCPRQRGWLRVLGPLGKERVKVRLPAAGLFEVRLNRQGDTVWCLPLSWFARGLAGCPWLPADAGADTVFVYDVGRQAWTAAWRFPDAVSDLGVHPGGEQALVSCWDGKAYLVGRDGGVRQTVDVGQAGRLQWSADGRLAVLGTQGGQVWGLDARGRVRWRTVLPSRQAPPLKEPLRPVFDGVPIYSVGRVGSEHAYVGDIWLIRTPQGGILVDTGGTSGLPLTWRRLQAAGVEPKEVRFVLLSHSHGDHAGAAYLWRTQGARIVAPATAAFTVTWTMPTWSDYSIWVPCPIDQPLPLQRAGDEAEVTLCGVRIKAIFVPGHSFDSVVYVLELGGKRVAFTGDLGFEGGSHILHRCWGEREKALTVLKVVRGKVLPLRPVHVFTGHGPRRDGTAFLQDLCARTQKALAGGQRR